MWIVASVLAPERRVRFYRFYENRLPWAPGYRFRVVCTADDEPEALRIVDGLEERRLRAKYRRRRVA